MGEGEGEGGGRERGREKEALSNIARSVLGRPGQTLGQPRPYPASAQAEPYKHGAETGRIWPPEGGASASGTCPSRRTPPSEAARDAAGPAGGPSVRWRLSARSRAAPPGARDQQSARSKTTAAAWERERE